MRSWYLRIVRLGGVEVFLPFKGFIQIGLNMTSVLNHASINGYYHIAGRPLFDIGIPHGPSAASIESAMNPRP